MFLGYTGWAHGSPLALASYFQSKAVDGHGLILVPGTWRLTRDTELTLVSPAQLWDLTWSPISGIRTLAFSSDCWYGSPPPRSWQSTQCCCREAPAPGPSSLGARIFPEKSPDAWGKGGRSLVSSKTQARAQSSVPSLSFPLCIISHDP